jgi:hypothetical protein
MSTTDAKKIRIPRVISGLAVTTVALFAFTASALAAPVATTQPATSVHHTSAVLNGHLDPTGDPGITDCHFQWGIDTSYSGGTLPCDQGNSFGAPADVSATLGNLTPDVTYHFQLVVSTTSNGVLLGGDQTVIPLAFPTKHVELTSFGPDGTIASTFDGNRFSPLAMRQSTRQLYVLNGSFEPGGGIYAFDASAPLSYAPIAPFNPLPTDPVRNSQMIAVDSSSQPSSGNVYYVTPPAQETSPEGWLVHGFDASGNPLGGNFPLDPGVNPGGFSGGNRQIGALTVDDDGNLWVSYGADTTKVLKYSAAGVFEGAVDVTAQTPFRQNENTGGPVSIALDSSQNLYVASIHTGVWRYSAASGYVDATQITRLGVRAIAIDSSDDHLFLTIFDLSPESGPSFVNQVREYDRRDNLLSVFAENLPQSGFGYQGLAVDSANHYIYVGSHVFVGSSWASQVHVFDPGTTLELPTVTPEPPTVATGNSVTLHARVDPEGNEVTDCNFEWDTTTAYGHTAPCTPNPGSGSGDVDVAADLSNLNGGTTYHFRILAANANGSVNGQDQTFTTGGPRIKAAAIDYAKVTTDAASVTATINPQGEATTFHLEYGLSASYGSTTGEKATSAPDSLDHAVSEALIGLDSGSAYHVRIVATNASGTSASPDLTFATYAAMPEFGSCLNDSVRDGAGARLPDCRAYEQVSPIDKNGADVSGVPGLVNASPAGDAVTFVALNALSGAVGAQAIETYLSRRLGEGWETKGIFPPPSVADRIKNPTWTSDLSQTFTNVSLKDSPDEGWGFVNRDSATGSVSTIHGYTEAGNGGLSQLVGTSADDSKIYFIHSATPLTPDAPPGVTNLYLWDRSTGSLSFQGEVPGPSDPECGGGGPECVAASGSTVGYFVRDAQVFSSQVENVGYTQQEHAVSPSGNQVVFNDATTGGLYVRRDAAGLNPSTVRISAPEGGVSDPNGPQPATFQYATPSGSKVFFTSSGKLTSDASTGPGDEGMDLYSWDSSSGDLSDLAPGAEAFGMIGSSDDGEYVYFLANADLDGSGEATQGTCKQLATYGAVTGECNLYLLQPASPQPTFVAPMRNTGDVGLSDYANFLLTGTGFGTKYPGKLGQVSADGHTLLFRSSLRQTGYDNDVTCKFGINLNNGTLATTTPCPEFYRYDTATGIDCVSCNPTGAPPDSDPRGLDLIPKQISPFGSSPVYPRLLSEDGKRIFFQSSDKLVAGDVNGDGSCPYVGSQVSPAPSCLDVYEWEAPGAGTCSHAAPEYSAPNGGCFYLISSGQAAEPSFFADTSASGKDVFFFTRSRLVPQDADSLVDVYDARVDGGIAAQHAVEKPPCDVNSGACEGAGTSRPPAPGAATAAVEGAGNPPARRGGCSRHKVRRGHRCVPRGKHSKKHKSKHGARRRSKANLKRGVDR